MSPKSKRRGSGEGSVFLRHDGRWAAQTAPDPVTRKRKTVYGRSQAEVIEKLRVTRTQLASGLPVPDQRQTLARFLAWYSEEVLPTPRMKPSTAVQYRQVIEAYIVPHIGGVRLARLSPGDVQRMQSGLSRQGLKPNTIRYARAVLSGALRYAERNDLVPRNVVRLVDAPERSAARVDDTLTLEEAHSLLSSVRDHRLGALVTVALAVGLRRGEALALRWGDVDMERQSLTVSGTLKRRPGGGLYVDRPKTERSGATVPLPKACVAALQAHRRRQTTERLAVGPHWHDEDFVFTTALGKPIDGSNALKTFYRMCEGAGIERRRFHALRHSAATLMWEQGVPLDVISATLRHSGVSITKDIYIAFRPDVMRAGADAMDRALGGL